MGLPYLVVFVMGKLVAKKELAEIFGVSERTLTEWMEKGMPVKEKTGRGLANQYDTEDVIRWRVLFLSEKDSGVTGRERKDMAQAKLYELQLAKEAGQLVDGRMFKSVLDSAITTAKGSLRRSAREMKDEIEEVHGIKIELGFFTRHIDTALTRLSECKPELAGDS